MKIAGLTIGPTAESYSADEYDYEDDDFEDDEHHEKSPTKRVNTPHSSKKSPQKQTWDMEDEGAETSAEIVDNLNVEGQDLESYMKQYSSENNNAANNEDLACELKPLEGVRPKLDNAEEEKLLHKLGYSYSNHSSPVKGSYAVRTDNSPSPSLNHGQGRKKHDADQWSSGPYDITISEGNAKEEHPSTRTSKDTKNSPTPKIGDKHSNNNVHKVGFSLAKHVGDDDSDEDHGFTGPDKQETKKSKPSANYMDNFKNLVDDTEASPKDKGSSAVREPSAADLILLSKKQPTAGEERENAERVDALLMELFPERYEKKKAKAPKAGKKGNAGYSKNQSYGLAAPRAPASVEYLYSSSAANGSSNNSYAASEEDSGAPMPLMQSLDQQMKLLKKELKAKDDKIARLSEHAVMMGHHMDKLKGEAAHLTVQLREANLELDAKEGRLQEALKQRKKAKKAAANNGAGAGGGNGSNGDVAALENENARLRDREQALMDAIEELSNQNEDLIDKLKESMERELVLSSKRAAQISHNVSAIAEQAAHHQSYQYLPSIGAAGAGLRTQSQPDPTVAAAGVKRATRKKRA